MPSHTGFRAITPAIHASAALAAQWGPDTAVDKRRASAAFTKVSAHLGLSSAAIELMHRLLSFSAEADWRGGSRPLVWPDNLRLLSQLSFSAPTLKRAFRALSEAGLIAFRDSPNGKRYGRRRADGTIILESSFGIDLSPLGLNAARFEALFDQLTADQAERRALARRFSCHRRLIIGIIDTAEQLAVDGPWCDCRRDLEHLTELHHPRRALTELRSLCDQLAAVLERAQTAYAAAADTFEGLGTTCAKSVDKPHNLNRNEATSEPHKQNTNQINQAPLYKDRRSATAEPDLFEGAGIAGSSRLRKKAERPQPSAQPAIAEARPIDPKTLVVLCPNFAETLWSPQGPTWLSIVRHVEVTIRRHLAISDSTWREACRIMGPERASVATALIFEKHLAGLIESPGAYLNGMITKAESNSLNLPASLFHWKRSTSTHKNMN